MVNTFLTIVEPYYHARVLLSEISFETARIVQKLSIERAQYPLVISKEMDLSRCSGSLQSYAESLFRHKVGLTENWGEDMAR
jgi:hypothetical protein